MVWILVVLLGLHGLIHLMGFAKAFDYADLPQLTQPISRSWGLAWLAAAGLVTTSAVMLGTGARSYWIVGAVALVVSQAVICMYWRDAWAGTGANILLFLVVVHGGLTEGPWSFHAQYLRDANAGMARVMTPSVVTESDLARLPEPVQRYLRVTRAVGQPRVQNYRLRFRGRIRSAPGSRWMPFEAEQQSFADDPTRSFSCGRACSACRCRHSIGSSMGMPRCKLRLAASFRSRTREAPRWIAPRPTLFNDMCLLAPGTLIDSRIAWQAVDARTALARFTHAGQTIGATLVFDDAGQLVNFVSDDRSRSERDGVFTPRRFSTPARDYRDFGTVRLMSFGEARWLLPEGEFTYGEFTLLEIAYNVDDDGRR